MSTQSSTPKRRISRKTKAAVLALLVSGAGLACYLLPERYQPVCHACAKVLGLLVGGAP